MNGKHNDQCVKGTNINNRKFISLLRNLYFEECNRFLQFVCLLVCLVVSFLRWGEGVRYKDVEFLGDTPI